MHMYMHMYMYMYMYMYIYMYICIYTRVKYTDTNRSHVELHNTIWHTHVENTGSRFKNNKELISEIR